MPQLSRTFTNKDLKLDSPPPDIMDNAPDDIMDDGEIPSDVMDDETTADELSVGDNYKGPTTFAQGVIDSLTSGEALNTGMRGLKGYAKGAVLDIPETAIEGAKSAWNLAKNIAPIPGNRIMDRIKSIPSGISEMASNIGRTTMESGAHPEEFGRMMGQVTGQPLTTASVMKGAPGATRLAGYPTELAGKSLQNYPLTDFMPGSRFVVPPAIRRLDRSLISGAAGRGIESIGRKMKDVGKKPTIKVVDGKIVGEVDPPFMEGQIIDDSMKALPPSETSYYAPEKNPSAPIITPDRGIKKQLPPSKVFQYADEGELVDGMELPIKSAKPKVRLNPDGTYVDLNTGEIFNSTGKPMAMPINRNSSFFKKNQN